MPRQVTLGPIRLPWALAALIAATFVLSIGAWQSPWLLRQGALVLPQVFAGELWRLVTWAFLEMQPLSLLFACLMLYWFGRELAAARGAARFIGSYLGFAALVAAATSLVGRFLWPAVAALPFAGSGAVVGALVITWAAAHPDQEIYLFGLARLSGRQMIVVTVGGTVLWALFSGFAAFVPHFIAELLALAYAGTFRRWYLRWKLARLQRATGAGGARRPSGRWDASSWIKKEAAGRRRFGVLEGGKTRSEGEGESPRGDGDDEKPRWMN